MTVVLWKTAPPLSGPQNRPQANQQALRAAKARKPLQQPCFLGFPSQRPEILRAMNPSRPQARVILSHGGGLGLEKEPRA